MILAFGCGLLVGLGLAVLAGFMVMWSASGRAKVDTDRWEQEIAEAAERGGPL